MAAVGRRQAVSSTLEIPGGFLRDQRLRCRCPVLARRRRRPPFPCRPSREGPLSRRPYAGVRRGRRRTTAPPSLFRAREDAGNGRAAGPALVAEVALVRAQL